MNKKERCVFQNIPDSAVVLKMNLVFIEVKNRAYLFLWQQQKSLKRGYIKSYTTVPPYSLNYIHFYSQCKKRDTYE